MRNLYIAEGNSGQGQNKIGTNDTNGTINVSKRDNYSQLPTVCDF